MQPITLTRRAFVAALAASGLALAGCDQQGPLPIPSDTSEPEATAPDSPEEVNASVAPTLMATLPYEGGSCNPVGAQSALFVAAGWHVYEGLYELDLHTYLPTLGLAADIPSQVSELEYTVTLREDARFSDGSIVTAADVAHSFQLNRENTWYGPLLSFIQSLEVVDDATLTVNLNAPMGNLLRERLSLVRVFPARLTAEDLEAAPLGSGPWRYETIEAVEGGRITFVPNEYYAGSYPATCERMTWLVELDDEVRTDQLASGNALCMEAAPVVFADQIEEAGATLEYVPGFQLPFLMFNCRKAPFNDARVRQALFYALDIDSMISRVLGGHARPCTSLLPDYFRGYHRASTIYSFDREKARQLLADAGIAELALELRVNNNWVSDLAESIVGDWREIGVEATVITMDTPTLFADISTAPATPEEVLPFDVVLSPGDPSCFGNDPDLLITWWYGDNPWTRARTCWADTPAFAQLGELLSQARAAGEDEQQQIWNQCFDLIAAEVPLYPLFHREMATAYYEDQLEPYEPISTTGLLFLGTTPMKKAEETPSLLS